MIRNRMKLVGGVSDYIFEIITEFIWSQDGSKPLEDGGTVEPGVGAMITGSYYDATNALNKFRGLGAQFSKFPFAGGNMIVGARHLFVGTTIVDAVCEQMSISREEAITALSVEFGKPVIEIGVPSGPNRRKYQAEFHIDLTMAVVRNRVTGEEEILLNSPRKAVEELLAGSDVDSLPNEEVELLQTLQKLLLRNSKESPSEDLMARINALIGLAGLKTLEKRLITMIEYQKEYDLIETDLKSHGYTVVPIPNFDIGFNWANLIFSGRYALTAQLGVKIWDDYMSKLLSSKGYEPIKFKAAQKSLFKKGGLRCMSETYRCAQRSGRKR